MTPLAYVGLAYSLFWGGVFFYLLRLIRTSRELSRRVEELENSTP